jgi:hypothetical protein
MTVGYKVTHCKLDILFWVAGRWIENLELQWSSFLKTKWGVERLR